MWHSVQLIDNASLRSIDSSRNVLPAIKEDRLAQFRATHRENPWGDRTQLLAEKSWNFNLRKVDVVVTFPTGQVSIEQ